MIYQISLRFKSGSAHPDVKSGDQGGSPRLVNPSTENGKRKFHFQAVSQKIKKIKERNKN
jgi:hypothetical protein